MIEMRENIKDDIKVQIKDIVLDDEKA